MVTLHTGSWTEYIEDCRANGEEPLMYSQFCYHIQQDEQKHRAKPECSIQTQVVILKVLMIKSSAVTEPR